MKKVIQLTESDLIRLVKKVISEQPMDDKESKMRQSIENAMEDFSDRVGSECEEIYQEESNYYCKGLMRIFAENMPKFLNNVEAQFNISKERKY